MWERGGPSLSPSVLLWNWRIIPRTRRMFWANCTSRLRKYCVFKEIFYFVFRFRTVSTRKHCKLLCRRLNILLVTFSMRTLWSGKMPVELKNTKSASIIVRNIILHSTRVYILFTYKIVFLSITIGDVTRRTLKSPVMGSETIMINQVLVFEVIRMCLYNKVWLTCLDWPMTRPDSTVDTSDINVV